MNVTDLIKNPQTERNIAGRNRIRDGVLTPSPETKNLSDVTGQRDFIAVENFLTPQECQYLSSAFDKNRDAMTKNASDNDYWKGRILFAHDFLKNNPGAAQLLKMNSLRVTFLLSQFYKLKQSIYSDSVHIAYWPPGKFMEPHADNCNPDGSDHGMAWRDFASIIYLNDDYQGGEVYFTNLDIRVKPKAGMLLAFTAGMHHEHAVLKVESGERFTIASFYSFDKSHADAFIYGARPGAKSE
jgi:Rps23 Pro-64 3,4-dihydroxylase Tpa1-like proline 4-hydroxylase